MDTSALTFLLQTLGIFVVIITAMLTGGVMQALGYRFKNPRAGLRREQDIHQVLDPFFKAAEEFLFSEGFSPSHSQVTELMEQTSHPTQWEKVYMNPRDNIYAVVTTAHVPDVALPAHINYVSFFSDGSRLLTMNGRKHMVVGNTPKTEVLDPYNENPRNVLQAHRQRLDEMRGLKKPVTLTPAEFINYHNSSMDACFGSLVSEGLMARAEKGLFRLTFRGAASIVLRAIKGMKLRTQLLKRAQKRLKDAPPSGPDAFPPLPVAVEVQAFLRHRSLNEWLKVPARSKAIVFLITMALFIAIGAALFDPFYTAALILALIVHELGHALGMRMFGYKNINVMLLPMLGAVTTGLPKGDKKPWHEAVVLLMGPVPGLFLGTALLVSGSLIGTPLPASGTFGTLSGMGAVFLIINALNLIPVMPFDGGRLVNLLLLSRVPRLQSAFLVMSMLAVGAGALLLKEPVFGFLALALFFMSGKSFQHIRAVKALRANTDPAVTGQRNENRDLSAIFRLMREKPFRDLPFLQKVKTAHVLHEAAFGVQPSLLTSILFLGFYASLIIIVPTVVFGGFFVFGLLKPELNPLPTRDYRTEAAFQDGLTLTYTSRLFHEDFDDDMKIQNNTHTIKEARGGDHAYDFMIQYTSPVPATNGAETEGDNTVYDTIRLDRHGRVVFSEGEIPDTGGIHYLIYWIPASEVQAGDHLFDYFTAAEPQNLLGREVLPVTSEATTRYYDIETGFHLLTQLQPDKATGCDMLSWLSGTSDERVSMFASEMDRMITERIEEGPSVCIADLGAEQ